LIERGAIFADPYAVAIARQGAEAARSAPLDRADWLMRLFVAARSRIAEDFAAAAVARGIRQIVVLGAGLDTFGLRNPYAREGVIVSEVDHPATQQWKRERIAEAGLPVPASLQLISVDFEADALAERLSACGVDLSAPTFFMWLGVVPYLTREAIEATLAMVGRVPRGEVVFDYGEPAESLSGMARAALDARMARLAAIGEPWLSLFTPDAIANVLRAAGLTDIEDLGSHEIARRCGDVAAPLAGVASGHIVRATRA
jgi:methyltransferase (TIGR00027 family)